MPYVITLLMYYGLQKTLPIVYFFKSYYTYSYCLTFILSISINFPLLLCLYVGMFIKLKTKKQVTANKITKLILF